MGALPERAPGSDVMAGRKLGILVTGPNAASKTTTVDRAMVPFVGDPRVVMLHPDCRDSSTYKTDPETAQARYRDVWCGPAQVLVIEGSSWAARAVSIVAAANPAARAGYVHVISA